MHEMNLQCMLSNGKKPCFAHFCKLVDRTYLFTRNMIIPGGVNTGVWKRWGDKRCSRYSAEVSRDAECCNTNKRWRAEIDLSRGWTQPPREVAKNRTVSLDPWLWDGSETEHWTGVFKKTFRDSSLVLPQRAREMECPIAWNRVLAGSHCFNGKRVWHRWGKDHACKWYQLLLPQLVKTLDDISTDKISKLAKLMLWFLISNAV